MFSFTDDDLDFERYYEEHERKNYAEKVRPITDYGDEAFDRLVNGTSVTGECLPWEKTWDRFRFRPGELTIWAGVNGNGKSLVMGQTAIWLESPTVIASMEMLPETTTERIMRQATGVRNPTREYFDTTIHKLKNKLYIYNHIGSVKKDSILGMCHYAAKERSVKHVMIDSLVKCGMGVDDYNSQKKFVDKLCEVAKEHMIHVHLVVHIRKGKSEMDLPGKFDVKGAGEITDLADNVLIVARNKAKEEMVRMEDPKLDESAPDGFIVVDKQRNGEWEGTFGFWWHESSQQWTDSKNRSMRL
jgi:twinkle protein